MACWALSQFILDPMVPIGVADPSFSWIFIPFLFFLFFDSSIIKILFYLLTVKLLNSDFAKENVSSNFLNKLYIFIQNIIIKERFVSFYRIIYYKMILKNYSLIFNPYHIIYVSIYNIFFVYLFDNVKMKIVGILRFATPLVERCYNRDPQPRPSFVVNKSE